MRCRISAAARSTSSRGAAGSGRERVSRMSMSKSSAAITTAATAVTRGGEASTQAVREASLTSRHAVCDSCFTTSRGSIRTLSAKRVRKSLRQQQQRQPRDDEQKGGRGNGGRGLGTQTEDVLGNNVVRVKHE